MILYDQRTCGGLCLIFRLQGSVYGRVLPYALFSAAQVLMLKGLKYWDVYDFSDVFDHPYFYQIYTFVLGFVLVFRCNLAYQRFWEGRTCLELMSSKWSDAALQAVIFDNCAKKPDMDRRAFRARILSLFSLLHGTAIARLQDCEEDVEVIEGIDPLLATTSLNGEAVKDQVFMVFTWVQDTLIRRLGYGGLAVPAPIATRLFQELSNGMLGYNNAAKIHDTPFPFPYAQLITLALAILTLTCGFVMNCFVKSAWWAAVFTFVAIAGYYAINEVAIELEDPFGDDANDLPMGSYQRDYNNRLRPLLRLDEAMYRAPALELDIAAMACSYQQEDVNAAVSAKDLDDKELPNPLGIRQRRTGEEAHSPLEDDEGLLQVKWVSNTRLDYSDDEDDD